MVVQSIRSLECHDCTGGAESGASDAIGDEARAKQKKGSRKEGTRLSGSHAELVEATRAQLEACFGNGSRPPWADAATPEGALQIVSKL